MSALIVVIVVAFVSLAVVVVVSTVRRERRRRGALMTWAAAEGWSYVARDNSFARRWNRTPFGHGDRRRASNVISGTHAGRSFVAFDYVYETQSNNSTSGSGSSSQTQTHHFCVAVTALPTTLPMLEVTPENVLSKAGKALGFQDIELESEAFNRAYLVRADDRKFASDVLTPRTMEMLIARKGTRFRIDGSDLLTWSTGTLNVEKATTQLTTAESLIAAIPDFVWKDNGLRA